MMSEKRPHISDIFDLLEPLSAALVETGGPDLRTGFARATGGVDIPFIIEALVRNTQHSSDMVEAVARALAEQRGAAGGWLYVDDAKAALEASHHAELVADNARLHSALQGVSDLAGKALSDLDEALALIGGAA
jgi:hypothetical protein